MITNRAHIRPSSSPTYYAHSSDLSKASRRLEAFYFRSDPEIKNNR
nr:MAG TPA: hypothetical protein [Caudoviricetes sp.]